MIRITALVALSLLLVGCMRFQSRPQGPFAKPKKDIPPPYGAVLPDATKPLGGQSSLDMPKADPVPPLAPDERALIPPKPDAPAVTATPPVVTPDPAAKNVTDLKALTAASTAAWNKVTTYELQLTRREVNPKGVVNSEVLVMQYRREPMAVYTRNIGGSGKGRETVYNPGAFEDKLHVMLGEGDSKLMRAGFVAPPVSPDDARVKEKARYSIREAGFGRWLATLNKAVAGMEAGRLSADALVYKGEVKRDEYPHPLVGVTHTLRPADDPLLPGGGTRFYYFDMKPDSPSYGMPVIIVAFDAGGKEVEYYLSEKVKNPANLTDANFNPSRLGK